MKFLLPVALVLLAFGCAKKEPPEPPPPAAATAPDTQPAAAPPPAPAQTAATLPANSPIPASGVLLWLSADDAVASAQNGKVSSWTNALVPSGNAAAAHPERLPAVVPNALNGHAVVRFDGTDQMLKTSIDIGPARMPEGTIITVLSSTTADRSPLRKIYGDDNGGFDRTVGLDDRGGDKNFGAFIGTGVIGYWQIEPNVTYVVVDEYSPKELSSWVNGAPAMTKTAADWQDDVLPNLYLGGTGTVFAEYWSGDLAEILVYARKLSEEERKQVEDYLGQKYGVAMTRPN